MASSTFLKRENEMKRLDKAKEKDQRRETRKSEKEGRPAHAPGYDPDIAHIVPGPQPLPDED